MDHDAVLTLFDHQMRQHTQGGERVGDVVRQAGSVGDWNGVVWSGLDQTGADAAIAEQVRYFASLRRDFEWKLYAHDRPDDLGARLRAAGFTPEPEETVMVAEIRDLPTAVDLPEGVRLRPVTDAAGVDLMADVHEQAFGTTSARLREQLLAQLAQTPDTVSMTLAMAGDLPVSAARMELHPGTEFASLWGGGTLAAWRGRGIYRALIAHRARIAAEGGYRFLQVDATSQSRPILQRLGFVPLSTTTPYVYALGEQRH
ncbi:GNAT family N-acetyltransferase [Streptomyces lunaelactis]|uniref:GNAT family N-acetyltransferase n=1 Tax=Streptomyces lunaelactis TaxID=1535768 RepID=UPI0015853FC6|nr:GNAT family N-acetyltransferase [Streptomyces lunaelactis]NUK05490.1 GNAT family N-acetyltransferase [Streptomyces lunaelactis]NUK19879.1 GNAT family N-acetyltransferase [Streptomyces lunaelactis]NUK27329.1 GNAT family N-acetyltransferase [Streptomyces lunaelactis]NUK38404.1 GNAT family N-acetyltransferase [Streptomyces lunaelactis]NUK45455.1 GNAT family N-acetyltransferase [Streptomyces lunaelactis]